MSRKLEEILYNDNLPKFRESLSTFVSADKKKIVDYKETSGSPNVFFRSCVLSKIPFVEFMLAECQPNLELRGPFIIQDEDSEHMVTPSWHAAATGNLDLLRLLKDAGGSMDACSDTGSSAVLAACYMLHFDVVKYLLFNKANIHTVNVKGLTCLMSAVHNVDLVRLLLLNGAEANRVDVRGNTAMHYAAEDGHLTVVRILHELGGNPLLVNHDGYNVIQTAAKHRRREMMEFLLQASPSLKVEDIIDVYELFGSMAILLDYDLDQGYSFFYKATTLRFMNKSSIVPKRYSRVSELGKMEDVREFNTLVELTQLTGKTDALTIQALLTCERQRGCMKDDYLHLLIYCGATFADRMDFRKAANLWKLSYTLNYKKHIDGNMSHPDPFNQHLIKTVLSVVKLLFQWKREDSIGFDTMGDEEEGPVYYRIPETTTRDIFLLLCEHLSSAQNYLRKLSIGLNERYKSSFSLLLRSVLCVLLIYIESYSALERHESIWQRFQALVSHSPRGKHGQTFLHMSASLDTLQLLELDSIGQFSQWPSVYIVDVLLLFGANPTAVDDTGNTPLHVAANLRHKEISVTTTIVKSLLNEGAHPDQVNSLNQTPINLSSSGEVKHLLLQHVTLKCLSARVIAKHNIPYLGEIPSTLYSFVELHREVTEKKKIV